MITYIAAPYSNVPDKGWLMNEIAKYCAKYMINNPGEYTITGLCHHYACQHDSRLGTDWEFWKTFCEEFIQKCDKVVVLMFDGWEESFGVQEEIRLATELGIPVVYGVVEHSYVA